MRWEDSKSENIGVEGLVDGCVNKALKIFTNKFRIKDKQWQQQIRLEMIIIMY